MQSPRLLIGLLVAATVLVDLVVFTLAGPFRWPQPEWPHPAMVALFSLAFSQVSLLAIWAVLSGTRSWLRWLGLVSGIAAWSMFLTMLWSYPPDDSVTACYTVLLSGQAGGVLLVLVVVRMAGGRLIRLSHSDQVPHEVTLKCQFQFSIRQMLGWTTALAVTLALLRYLGCFDFALSKFPPWQDAFVMWLGSTAVALAAVWMLLATRHWAKRRDTFWLAVLATIAAWILSGRGTLMTLVVVPLEALLLAGSLWVVRMAGYRMVGRADRRTEAHDQ